MTLAKSTTKQTEESYSSKTHMLAAAITAPIEHPSVFHWTVFIAYRPLASQDPAKQCEFEKPFACILSL